MKIGDLFWLGLENIRVRKLRTVLNLVGMLACTRADGLLL